MNLFDEFLFEKYQGMIYLFSLTQTHILWSMLCPRVSYQLHWQISKASELL